MAQVALKDFLTEEEIVKIVRLWAEYPKHFGFAAMVCERIIRPNIERIDASLGQKNDPMYLAYTVEYVMQRGAEK